MRWIFFPIAWIYGGIMAVRNLLYDWGVLSQEKLKIPVISIGNLTMGGSGKTPFVLWLVDELKRRNLRVMVVARPYPLNVKKPKLVKDQHHAAGVFGDEACLISLSSQVPVVVSNSKRESARLAASMGAQVIVVDDGFQHRSLQRDLDIVLINGAQAKNQLKVFPVGNAREWCGSLERAHFVFTTKAQQKFVGLNVQGHFALKDLEFRYELGGPRLEVQNAVLVSAIAHNSEFAKSIQEKGVQVIKHFEFADHHSFNPSDLDPIVAEAFKHGAQCVLCTEKDAVKLRDLWKVTIPLVSARQTYELVKGKEELYAAMDRLFS